MSKGVERINQGPDWLQSTVNNHGDQIEANEPIAGDNVTVVDLPAGGGKMISVQFPATAAAAIAALQVIDVSSGGTPKISVTPGTFGQNAEASSGDSVPTISGTRIDDTTPPVLTVSSSDVIIYLEVDVNSDGQITAVSVNSSTSADPPDSDPTTLYVTLAFITVGADTVETISPNLSGSQSYELCGGTNHLYALI